MVIILTTPTLVLACPRGSLPHSRAPAGCPRPAGPLQSTLPVSRALCSTKGLGWEHRAHRLTKEREVGHESLKHVSVRCACS